MTVWPSSFHRFFLFTGNNKRYCLSQYSWIAIVSVISFSAFCFEYAARNENRILRGVREGGLMSQRKPEDRRRSVGKRSFPFRDSKEGRVLEERRKQPDRRMNGIDEAEWLEMPELSEG